MHPLDTSFHYSGSPGFIYFLIMVDNDLAAAGIGDGAGSQAAYDTVAEDRQHALFGGLVYPGADSITTVGLTHDNVLCDIHQTARQITGAGGTQSGIGQTFTGAVRRYEVFQRAQSLAQ